MITDQKVRSTLQKMQDATNALLYLSDIGCNVVSIRVDAHDHCVRMQIDSASSKLLIEKLDALHQAHTLRQNAWLPYAEGRAIVGECEIVWVCEQQDRDANH